MSAWLFVQCDDAGCESRRGEKSQKQGHGGSPLASWIRQLLDAPALLYPLYDAMRLTLLVSVTTTPQQSSSQAMPLSNKNYFVNSEGRNLDSPASMLLGYRSTPKTSTATFLIDLLHYFYRLYCFFALGCASSLNFACLHLLSRARSVLLSLHQDPAALHVRGNRSWSFVGEAIY